MAASCARRPALLVDVLGLDDLLHQAELVVSAEDREIGAQADELGMAAQDLGADGVEGAEPLHAFGDRADEGGDALAHLPRGLVGEGDGEDVRTDGLAGGDQVSDPGRQHAGLAGAGAGEHENRPFGRLHGGALLRVQAGQIGRLRRDRRSGAGAQGSRMPAHG